MNNNLTDCAWVARAPAVDNQTGKWNLIGYDCLYLLQILCLSCVNNWSPPTVFEEHGINCESCTRHKTGDNSLGLRMFSFLGVNSGCLAANPCLPTKYDQTLGWTQRTLNFGALDGETKGIKPSEFTPTHLTIIHLLFNRAHLGTRRLSASFFLSSRLHLKT